MPDNRFYWKLWDDTDKRYVGEPIAASDRKEAYDLFNKASVLASRENAMRPDHQYKITQMPKAKYGWLITRDHLWEDSRINLPRHDPDEQPEVGMIGPRGISPEFKEKLELYKEQLLTAKATKTPKRIPGQKTFYMYDDDGILYYTGIALGNLEGDEPLRDFGGPNAGCTLIKWPRFPEMTAEY